MPSAHTHPLLRCSPLQIRLSSPNPPPSMNLFRDQAIEPSRHLRPPKTTAPSTFPEYRRDQDTPGRMRRCSKRVEFRDGGGHNLDMVVEAGSD